MLRYREARSSTFEPLLEDQSLAASCSHAASMEEDDRRPRPLLRVQRAVKVELYIE